MEERKRIILTFSLFSVFSIFFFLLIFALFPYIPNGKVSSYFIQVLLAEIVNVICNSTLMLGYGNKLVKEKKIPYKFSMCFAYLFSALFIICIAAMLPSRPEKKVESEVDKILH